MIRRYLFLVTFLTSLQTASAQLAVTFGSNGLQTLSYNGTSLENLTTYPQDGFVAGHIQSTTTTSTAPNSAGDLGYGQDCATHTFNTSTLAWTYGCSWGGFTTTYAVSGNNLNITTVLTNNANSGEIIDGVDIFPLVLHFPTNPNKYSGASFGGYAQFDAATANAPIFVADYGTGIATEVGLAPYASISPASTGSATQAAIYQGWNLASNGGGYSGATDSAGNYVYTPIMTTTPPTGAPSFLRAQYARLQPGTSMTYTYSIRFTNEGTQANVADAAQAYTQAFPVTLNWTDRRVIGAAFLASNSSGGNGNNPVGPTGCGYGNSNQNNWKIGGQVQCGYNVYSVGFQDNMLTQAASNVINAKAENMQGVITWDIEGEPAPQDASYVCSPDQVATLAPEMEQAVTDTAFNGAPGSKNPGGKNYTGTNPATGATWKLDDAYFDIQTSGGPLASGGGTITYPIKVGNCLRPDVYTVTSSSSSRPNDTFQNKFTGDGADDPATNNGAVSTLETKVQAAYTRWGSTLFYTDSMVYANGGVMNESVMQAVTASNTANNYPVLMIPEALAGQWHGRQFANTSMLDNFEDNLDYGTPSDFPYNPYLVFPNAFSVNLINEGGPYALDSNSTPIIQNAVNHGEILMDHGDYASPQAGKIEAIESASTYTGPSSPAPGAPVTYYLDNIAGSDSNPGTSQSAPWATIAKLNTECQTKGFFTPGSQILLKAGDVFRDASISCGDTQNPASGATTSATPQYFAGTSAQPILVGSYGSGAAPVIDAADPLGTVTWTQDTTDDSSGNTYKAPLPSGFATPAKLYMDAATTESTQILPVPNYVGAEFNGTHPYLSAVTNGSGECIYGVIPSTGYSSIKSNWNTCVPGSSNGAQWFAQANTGVQNVVACTTQVSTSIGAGAPTYPGCFYTDGTSIWINLKGVNPNSHTFEGTHRQYGVQLSNTSWITVSGLEVIHPQYSGLLAYQYATAASGTWNTTDGINFTGNTVYNYGGVLANDPTNLASGNVTQMAGILLQDDGSHKHSPANDIVTGNTVGTSDGYFGSAAPALATFNLTNPQITHNFLRPYISPGLVFSQANEGSGSTISYNEITRSNQGNFFSNNLGGSFTHNYIHEVWGEGIQLGGSIANSASNPVLIQYNIISNEYLNYTGGLYNGIDCNGTALNAGYDIGWNTIVNTWGAAVSQEYVGSSAVGCQNSHIHDNILDQAHTYFPDTTGAQSTGANASNIFYLTGASATYMGATFNNNLYVTSGTGPLVAGGNGGTGNSAFMANDTTSKLLTAEPSPMYASFTEPVATAPYTAANTFTLATASPAAMLGSSGGPAGASPLAAIVHHTWYVRPKGGTRYDATNNTSGQCDGLGDADYPGTGTNQHCAFGDPRWFYLTGAYTTGSGSGGYGWVGSGGDTYLIRGAISDGITYRIGWSNTSSATDATYNLSTGLAGDPYGSGMPSPPSGTASAPTHILGGNYQNCSAQSARTQLHGGYGTGAVLSLGGASYVDVACLDITDFSQCTRGSLNACNTNQGSLDDYASTGIAWTNTATYDTMENVRIHGLAANGMSGPTGTGMVFTGLGLLGNASSGWNADPGTSPDTTGTGTLVVNGFQIEGNGCAEEYPIKDPMPYTFCADDNVSGGYGDGFGTATVASSPGWQVTWENGTVDYNTQDGLDALHLNGVGSSVTEQGIYAYGNMGQQLKTGAGIDTLRNNVIVTNCMAMSGPIPGFPSGYNANLTDFCRASDTGAVVAVGKGQTSNVQNNTFYSASKVALQVDCDQTYGACNGSEIINDQNNIFYGYPNDAAHGYPNGTGQYPDRFYNDSLPTQANADPGALYGNNFAYHMKNPCPDTSETNAHCNVDPKLAGEGTYSLTGPMSAVPLAGSPVIAAGTAIPSITTDILGTVRASTPSIGAYDAAQAIINQILQGIRGLKGCRGCRF